MEKERDVNMLMAKLSDEARNLNVQRFRNAMKIKVT